MIRRIGKISLRSRIVNYIKRQETWISGVELERLALGVGYKASNASRRARELAEEGTLERKEEKGSVWYKYHQRVIQRPLIVIVDNKPKAIL